MAYTYNDFISAATGAKLLDKFSESDLNTAKNDPEYGISMLKLQQDEMNATTAEQKLLAQEAANQLRRTHGTAGNGYASSYGGTINDLMGQIQNYGSFGYENQNAYQEALAKVNNYGEYSYGNEAAYQQLLNNIVNQQPFKYDHTEDPQYSAYKKGYLREAERAREDTLAKASVASGGVPSSYAVMAASQAGDYYTGQLNDAIPTLYQNAYQQYLNDASLKHNALGALESDRAFDYQNYLNQYNQLQNNLNTLENDRAFDYENWLNQYNQLQNNLNNLQQQDATDYQRYLDTLDQAYQAEQNTLAQKQQEFANALALYQTLGYVTPEMAAILGIGGGAASGGVDYGGIASGGSGGIGSGAGAGGGGNTGIPSNILASLKTAYPDGNVTNSDIWNQLVNDYGTEALAAAGYRGSLTEDNPVDYAVNNETTDNGVYIDGDFVSWSDLLNMVNDGEVVESMDDKTGAITYTYVNADKGVTKKKVSTSGVLNQAVNTEKKKTGSTAAVSGAGSGKTSGGKVSTKYQKNQLI